MSTITLPPPWTHDGYSLSCEGEPYRCPHQRAWVHMDGRWRRCYLSSVRLPGVAAHDVPQATKNGKTAGGTAAAWAVRVAEETTEAGAWYLTGIEDRSPGSAWLPMAGTRLVLRDPRRWALWGPGCEAAGSRPLDVVDARCAAALQPTIGREHPVHLIPGRATNVLTPPHLASCGLAYLQCTLEDAP